MTTPSDLERTFRLLLVEDEPADVHLVRLALRDCAVPVELNHVQDGCEALSWLQARCEDLPDLMLVDLNMPRMGGLELIERMRDTAEFSVIPIVIITTSSADPDLEASKALGVDAYLVKPLDADTYLATLRATIEDSAARRIHPATMHTEPQPAPTDSGRAPVVLLVEDDPGDAHLIRLNLLESRPDAFEVHMAHSLAAAEACLAQEAFEPDVVLLDLNLPDSNGPQTVERCRTISSAPIIVLTGLDDRAASRVAIESGADDYLTKGRSGSELRRAIHYSMLRHRRDADARLAAAVFANAREAIMITDVRGHIIDVNATFTQLTGFTRDEAVGQKPSILRSGRQEDAFQQSMWETLHTEGFWHGELWNCKRNGEEFATLQTVSAVRDHRQRITHFVSLFTDITLQKENERRLESIAHFDTLTGLPNRVLFADRLRQVMANAKRRSSPLGVLFIDLDGFKAVNDDHGHDVGDQLLKKVADNMRSALRESDTLARLGGDEFAAILPDLPSNEHAAPLLDRLLRAIARDCVLPKHRLKVSASIGLSYYPQQDEVDAEQLLRQADQAMYIAKQGGKNRFHVFDAALDRDTRDRNQMLDELRRGLQLGEFELHYQPKINMRSNEVVGLEALIRWRHPEHGLLRPAAFMPACEEHSLSVNLGAWVISRALLQLDAWNSQGLRLSVSVNISARHLQSDGFVEGIAESLARHPAVHASQLELEIVETSALEDISNVMGILGQTRRLGCSIAFDDFGTGYSSLSYLKRLPAQVIKIDQSFVRDILHDPNDLAIVKAVIGLAKSFDRQVIAEGVENREIGETLLALDCEHGQGYGIAHPMPADEVATWIEAWQRTPVWLDNGRAGSLPIQ